MSPHPTGQRRRSASAVLAAFMLVLLLPVSASAHAELQSSVPVQGAVVPAPFGGPIALTFTESLAVGSKADLYGPGHQLVASATIDAGTMTISPASPLPVGDYTVEWVSIADDGDLLRGTVAFTVATQSPSAEASASASTAPSTAPTNPPSAVASGLSSSSTAPVSASASPAPTGTTGGSGSDVILPIVIVLVLVAAGAFYLVRRNRPA